MSAITAIEAEQKPNAGPPSPRGVESALPTGNAHGRNRIFLYVPLLVIAMMMMLSACAYHGVARMTKVKASEVFSDPSVIQLADAAARGDRRAVAELARQGVDVNARGDRQTPVLLWALFNQNIDGMLALLEAGADPELADEFGDTVMHYAAMVDNPRLLRALLAVGIPPDLRNLVNGKTPLFNAIVGDREPQFRALLAAGADVNVEDQIRNRPLHQAAKVNDMTRILVLLEAGADPGAVNERGSTFQRYLNMGPERWLTTRGREKKEKIRAWLMAHGVEVEPGEP